MAYSRINYVGNGSQTQFAINFPLGFLTRSDVTCYVIGEVDGLGNQVYRPLTWINDGLVEVSGVAPANGTTIVLERTVSKDTLVHDYSDGSAIIEENLDQSNKQNIMLTHEVLDGRLGVLADDLDMGQHTVKNLVDPVADQDAVNLRYFEANNASANRLAAEAAQAAAELAEAHAELAEANAEAAAATAAADVVATLAGYVTAAQTAKTAAEFAETNAETAEVNAEAAQAAAEAARDEVVVAVGGIKITSADTTAAKANDKILVSGSLTKTVLNPGGNEQLQLGFDMSSTNSAISVLSSQVDTLKTNLAMTIIRLIANAGSSYMGMVDGWADEFEDQTGIVSIGAASYDAAGDYIHNPAPSANVFAGIVPTCNVSIGAGALANVTNGVTNGTDYAVASGAQAGNFRLRFDCGSGASHKPTKFRQWIDSAQQSPGNFNLYGSLTGSFGGEEALIASGSYTNTTGWQEHTFTAPVVGYRYFEVRSTTSVNSANPSNNPRVFEMELHVPTSSPDVTVTSISKTADAVPSQGRVTLVVDPQVSVSYGTDNSIRMSRDGGTTWVTGTMTTEAVNLDFPGSYTVDVVTAAFDFTGTPSGTSMKLEWATMNNKHQLLHAWYPEWRV